LLYEELRRLAGGQMARQAVGHTLQPTALVNEAYLKLAGHSHLSFANRASFFALMARAMRQILVDHARTQRREKRGGDAVQVELSDAMAPAVERPRDVVALDDALQAMAKVYPRKAEIIELRYFGGLSSEEIASALGIGTATVTRDAALAEAWLRREMTRAAGAAE